MSIYIWKSDEQLGPYSEDEIRARIDSGELELDIQARSASENKWRPLSEVLTPSRPPLLPGEVPASLYSLDNPPPLPPGELSASASPADPTVNIPPLSHEVTASPTAEEPSSFEKMQKTAYPVTQPPPMKKSLLVPVLAGVGVLLVLAGAYESYSHWKKASGLSVASQPVPVAAVQPALNPAPMPQAPSPPAPDQSVASIAPSAPAPMPASPSTPAPSPAPVPSTPAPLAGAISIAPESDVAPASVASAPVSPGTPSGPVAEAGVNVSPPPPSASSPAPVSGITPENIPVTPVASSTPAVDQSRSSMPPSIVIAPEASAPPSDASPQQGAPTSNQAPGPVAEQNGVPAIQVVPSTAPATDVGSGTVINVPPTGAPDAQVAPGGSPPPQPQTEERQADSFNPDSILLNVVANTNFGAVLQGNRFDSNYRGRTMEFTGTVARLNERENLVVFHGGGVYPRNWDLQLTKHRGQVFSPSRSYRVTFRLNYVKAIPFGGFSFRGEVLDRSAE